MSCSYSCDTKPVEPNDKQKEFAQKLLEAPEILEAESYNSTSIEVTDDLGKLDINPELKAKQLANQIASAGYSNTGKGLCVSIYYPNRTN